MRPVWLTLALVVVVGCGPSNRANGDGDGKPAECSGTEHRCNGSTYQVCTNGQFTTQDDCPAVCNDDLGCVACQPGAMSCGDDGNVHTCDVNGQLGGVSNACTGANVCSNGACVDACTDAAMHKSYIGCEYWAADLDNAVEVLSVAPAGNCTQTGAKKATLDVCVNGTQVGGLCDAPANTCPAGLTCTSTAVCILDAQHGPFAIVVSNPQARPVNVTVTPPVGAPFMQTIAANQVQAILPQAAPQNVPDQSLDGTGKEHKAYKLTSDLPIVAYQFNPLDNVNVFSNDASLLIPRTAFDIEYYAMTYPTLARRPQAHDYHGYVTVVAWQDNTIIEITPTANVLGSATQPAIAANTPTQFTLAAHDTLTLEAVANGDLTGTKVRSVDGVQTFGVFSGHEATVFGETTPPDATHPSGPCCADHLEEMLFPTSTWGKTFAISRSQSRGTNEPDMLRVMAQKANTMVTFDPAPSAGTCGMLQPGKFCEVKIQVDTAITSTDPILVGHYLESAIWQGFGTKGEGDPSFAVAVPTEQFRKSYTLLVPNAYGKNYLSISAPANGLVQVDGITVVMQPYGSGNYRGTRQLVNPGQHKINCPSGCGVEVYGYSDAVSYMFAGGLDLTQIVIN